MQVEYNTIGVLRSPHKSIKGMPIQPTGAQTVEGRIELFEEFAPGLADLEGFSHVVLVVHLHKIVGYDLKVTPFLDNIPRGVFATRSPKRPNPIGISVLRVVKVVDNCVYVKGVDLLDGTPVLDIKPYIPDFDQWEVNSIGWFEGKSGNAGVQKSDDRFAGSR